MCSLFLDWKAELTTPVNCRELMATNDSGTQLFVYGGRLEIKFSDEEEVRVFYLDTKELFEKIECCCKEVCFDRSSRTGRKLMFELDKLSENQPHTIRISILNTWNDNFRVEVLRCEFLAALAFFVK